MPEYPARCASFRSLDGLEIFYRIYPSDSERARIVVVHGLGEHSGRYGNLVESLRPRGISIWAHDQRGHGRSSGTRGHVSSFQRYVDDLHSMVAISKKGLNKGEKTFLFGHSLGGLISLSFAALFMKEIDGLILSSPALGLPETFHPFKNFVSRILSVLCPTLGFSNAIDASTLSHDQGVVSAYLEDPLVHSRVTARWFCEFVRAMEEAKRVAGQLDIPVLIQLAGDDTLTSSCASKQFFEELSLEDKTLFSYDGLYHEIYNEKNPNRDNVIGDLCSWLERHI